LFTPKAPVVLEKVPVSERLMEGLKTRGCGGSPPDLSFQLVFLVFILFYFSFAEP